MTNDRSVPTELELRKLVADVAFAGDLGDLDDYLALFTEDATWEVRANPASGVPSARCVGREEIAASVQHRRALGVQGPGTDTMHHLTTQHFDLSGPSPAGHIYYQFVGNVDGRPTIRTLGEYRDRYQRTADGWRLAHRTVIIR